MNKELTPAYDCLPDNAKYVVLALSVVIDRLGSLPKVDRDEVFGLLQELHKTDDSEERQSIRLAMEEILAQVPIGVSKMQVASEDLKRGQTAWAIHVGKTIRDLREDAGLTQVQLAEKAGIPQSHVSRLENAEHSATHLTLCKIATALGVEVGRGSEEPRRSRSQPIVRGAGPVFRAPAARSQDVG